ncbi:hypothetical protein M514_01423 [Trichuris suis]|uniref:Uncharacterized protein n=1 Tax=Trichuris suis TaxID=68888 RepID=A0A085MKK7_9BILA|nr:hypothetical protein M513_01423 [Trichuris suis]KFD65525.1 hypothetical protein M514_01423 [Trichuris suis]
MKKDTANGYKKRGTALNQFKRSTHYVRRKLRLNNQVARQYRYIDSKKLRFESECHNLATIKQPPLRLTNRRIYGQTHCSAEGFSGLGGAAERMPFYATSENLLATLI